MKLITQTILAFVEGKSEKVYEVDLCEVGTGKFVVNFRYGKKGAALKDGSKTVAPVSRAEADKVFQKLVQSKIEQGYVREEEAAAARAKAAAPPVARAAGVAATGARAPNPQRDDERKRIVLERLAQSGTERRWFRRAGANRTWPLERAIWRAGELRIREAEAPLLALVDTATSADAEGGGKGIRNYSICHALGRLGTEASIPVLARLRSDPKQPGHVQRIATEALLRLSDPEMRAEFGKDILATLPTTLRTGYAAGEEAFGAALRAHLATTPEAFAVMDLVYLVNDEIVRPAFLKELADAKLEAPYFFWLRHIFKAAEYRNDPRVFGVFVHKFETTRANPYSYETRRKTYGPATREFLRRRVWRTLRRLGEAGDADFVPLAVGTLLSYSDADGEAVRPRYDAYAKYRTLNHLLYTNSPRYELRRNTVAFRLKGGYRPGSPPPPVREEAFPTLWEARPEGLMQLVAESACAPVHEFAAKALEACPAFLANLDDDDIVLVLGRPYAPTARLGFTIVRGRYAQSPASPRVLVALAESAHEPGRTQAFSWMDERRAELSADTVFLAGLVTARHAAARAFAHTWVRGLALSPEVGAALVGRVIALVMALPDDATSAEIALDVARTVSAALGHHLASAGPAALRDLLSHPLAGVQEIGAELLSRLDSRSGLVPVDIVLSVLKSPFPNVRAVGMRLLAEMHDDAIALNFKILVHLSSDKNTDLRIAARPLVGRVARAHREIGIAIAEGLVEALLRRKLADGVPTHVLSVLRDDLADVITELSRDTVWKLLRSGSQHAQELGGILLARVPASELEIPEIVELGSHAILSVRQAAWTMFESDKTRIEADLPAAARLCDATWADTRARAFAYFRNVSPDLFTASVLVSIIDSVKEDVQAFGRELASRAFKDEDGPVLLLRLSEHPQRSVQLFATNYLERFASADLSRLESLVPYFTSVLSRVNQGRVAKSRVLAFLRKEGLRDAEAAKVVIAILHRLSATIAVEDGGLAIETMVAIGKAHPSVPLPIRFLDPPTVTRASGPAARAGGTA